MVILKLRLKLFFAALILGSGFFALAEVGPKCSDGQYHARSHHRRAYYRSDGTFVRATRVADSCREKRKGHDFWTERLKNDFPAAWPHKMEKSTKWTNEEQERVLEALSELPEELWDQSIKGIYRLKKSKDHPNPSSYGGSMIVLYDNAFSEDRRLARLLAHELAHHMYEKIEHGEVGSSYRKATGWRPELEGRDFYWTGRKEGYVEEDGAREPSEDFANNLEHFLFDLKRLQKITPSAYDWIKKQFSDRFKVRGGNQ